MHSESAVRWEASILCPWILYEVHFYPLPANSPSSCMLKDRRPACMQQMDMLAHYDTENV